MAKEFRLEDDFDNSLVVIDDGARIEITIQFSVKKEKYIGYIDTASKTLFIRARRGLDLNHKHNAYGFYHKLVSETKKFTHIQIEDELKAWVIPVDFIIKNGTFHKTKQQGFEREIFISLEQMEQFEIQKTD